MTAATRFVRYMAWKPEALRRSFGVQYRPLGNERNLERGRPFHELRSDFVLARHANAKIAKSYKFLGQNRQSGVGHQNDGMHGEHRIRAW